MRETLIKTFYLFIGFVMLGSMVGFDIKPDVPASYSQKSVDSLISYYEDSLTKQQNMFDSSLANLSLFITETFLDSIDVLNEKILRQVKIIEDADTCLTFNGDGTSFSAINTSNVVHFLEIKGDTSWYKITYKDDVTNPFYMQRFIIPNSN